MDTSADGTSPLHSFPQGFLPRRGILGEIVIAIKIRQLRATCDVH